MLANSETEAPCYANHINFSKEGKLKYSCSTKNTITKINNCFMYEYNLTQIYLLGYMPTEKRRIFCIKGGFN